MAIHFAVTFIRYPMLIRFTAKAPVMLLRQRVRRWMDRVTTTVLIGLGIELATEAR